MPELPFVHIGTAYLLADRIDDAIGWARKALDACQRHGARGSEAHALHLLGQVAALRDPPVVHDAEKLYREALTLANELGMRPLVAHCHLGLGQLFWKTDKREQAREHLGTATTMYREMA
jgi:tetratricopeptide (TPR) repeat protein